ESPACRTAAGRASTACPPGALRIILKASYMVDAVLITDVGDGAETEVRLGEETSIGRATSNTIVIDDTGVSRRHALIRAQATGEFILIDLGSSNGTLLNGERLGLPCPLRSGDVVRIGPATLTFQGGADEPAV